MPDSTSFADLLAAARQGSQPARDRLFARVADRLLLYVRMRLGDGLRRRVDSLDVLQEAFLHAHRDVGSFAPTPPGDPERQFAQWLCRVADRRIHDLADRHRAARRDVGREQRQATEVLGALRRSGAGPATLVARQEERERLAAAVEALPDDERAALVLRHFEGLTLDEVATRTGRSASAVRRALGRALQTVGRQLQEVRR